MALTEKKLHTTPESSPLPAAADPQPRLPRGSALGLMAAWLILFPAALVLEPAAAAEATQPWWGYLMSMGLLGAVIATFVGLARGMRWGMTASLAASSILVAGVFACPATGHHAIGLWWFGQFAAALALLGFSGRAYLRASR